MTRILFCSIVGGFLLLYGAIIAAWYLCARKADAVDEAHRTAMAALTPDAPALAEVSPQHRRQQRMLQRLDCNIAAAAFSRQRHLADAVLLSDARAAAWDQIVKDLEGINR